jgi:hypothetical protein
MVKLKDIRQGSVVIVRTDFGTGIPVRAIVDTVDENIKNGLPGIDYTYAGAANWHDGSWAYLSQVERVVTY